MGRWVDFNEILLLSEKRGGNSRPYAQMLAFNDALNDCGLPDISYIGDPFTWCNKISGPDRVLAFLDRFLCSSNWHLTFPTAEVVHLSYLGSDHMPILLRLSKETHHRWINASKRFTFEHKWLLEEDFTHFFKQSWRR